MDDEGHGGAPSHGPPPPHPPPPGANGGGGGGGSSLIMQTSRKFPDHTAYILQQLNMQRNYSNSGGGGGGGGGDGLGGELCDVTVRVEEGYDFRLHRCVLAAVSSKLQAMMYSTTTSGNGGSGEEAVVSLQDVTVSAMRVLVDWVYTGTLRLDSLHVHEVLTAAHCLGLDDVHRACRDFLRELHHSDLQARNSAMCDSSLGMFRSNAPPMLSMHTYGPMDLQQGFPTDLPSHSGLPHTQGIPHDQQSMPPDPADDMCGPESNAGASGILHGNTQRMHGDIGKSMDAKMMQNQGMVGIGADHGRLIQDPTTFNLNGFSSQPPPPPLPHQSVYQQTNEQLLPLNLHRVPNNQLMMGNKMDMGSNVMSNQGMGGEQLMGGQGFDGNGGGLMLMNDQYGSSNLLGTSAMSSGMSSGMSQEGNSQMLGPGHGDMMTGPLTPIQPHSHHQQHMQQHEPLTPASTHQTEPPQSPTPTSPLQPHVFPNIPLEDYLKFIDAFQGEQQQQLQQQQQMQQQQQQHLGQLPNQTDTLQMDQMCGYGSKEYGGGQMGAGLMGGMDMEPNLIPPPLPPQCSMSQMMVSSSASGSYQSYIGHSMAPMVSRPMEFIPPPMLPTPPVSSSPLSLRTSIPNNFPVTPSSSSSFAPFPPSSSSSALTGQHADFVRKTVLNVLSQENFDDEENLLVKSLGDDDDDDNNGDDDGATKPNPNTNPNSNPKESMPLTSLLNIVSVNSKQQQQQASYDIQLGDGAGFQMGEDSDNEGNLVIADPDLQEQDLEEQVVYEACNIANTSTNDVTMDLENPSIGDPGIADPGGANDAASKWNNTDESPPNPHLRLLSECEDEGKISSNTDVQMENNFKKPLKKRLRLSKLKVNGENDESEVNTPIESEALPELTNQEQEPFSRKKHLLDMSKNMDNSQVYNSPTENNWQLVEPAKQFPVINVYPKDMNLFMPSSSTGLEQNEDMYQSKKQKASSKQQEDKEKDVGKILEDKQSPLPPMKPAHRKLLGNNRQTGKDNTEEECLGEESNLDNMQLPATLATMVSDAPDVPDACNPPDLMPPSLELAALASPQVSDERNETPPKLLKAKTTVTKTTKKQMKQSTKHNVTPGEKTSESGGTGGTEGAGGGVGEGGVGAGGIGVGAGGVGVGAGGLGVGAGGIGAGATEGTSTTSATSTTGAKPKVGEFPCKLCGRKFPKTSRLQAHLTQHKQNTMHGCKQCGQQFARLGELTRHERQQHPGSDTVYRCRTCSAQFPEPLAYRAHCLKVHGQRRMFYCTHPGCSFDAVKISLLEQHALVHSDAKTYTCENCGQSFRQPNGLTGHKRSCTKQEAYACRICSKKFNYRNSLKQHELTHKGHRPIECSVCFIRVSDPRNLRRHMRIHKGLYPYPCPHCPKKYRYSNTLKKHLKHHDRETDTPNTPTKTKPQKNVAKPVRISDAVVLTEDIENASEQPRLWDVTAVTVKNVDDNGEEMMKVKLEASLVTDSGYV